MSQILINYLGDLRTESLHHDSNTKILTDAPKDNEGLGRQFSPTDLVASALGSCLLTIMGIVAKRHGIKLEGSYAKIEKIMGSKPRRIKRINVELNLSNNIDKNNMKILNKAALHCPVHNSLSKEIDINISYIL